MRDALYNFALADTRVAGFIASSYANLDRKVAAGTFDNRRALALLRGNAVDAAKAYCRQVGYFNRKAFHCETLDGLAVMLMRDWRNRSK